MCVCVYFWLVDRSAAASKRIECIRSYFITYQIQILIEWCSTSSSTLNLWVKVLDTCVFVVDISVPTHVMQQHTEQNKCDIDLCNFHIMLVFGFLCYLFLLLIWRTFLFAAAYFCFNEAYLLNQSTQEIIASTFSCKIHFECA